MSATFHDLTTLRAIVFDIDGVLSPLTIPIDSEGGLTRMVNVRDAYAIHRALKADVDICVISGASDAAYRRRLADIGLTDIFMGVAEKLPAFLSWMQSRRLSPGQVVYVGDDLPDLPAMQCAGLSVAPADAAPDVLAVARVITRARGGYGVAREIIEQILRAKGLWLDESQAYSW